MCGIVGYFGERPVVDVLLKGLKALEYRGYDSAGIAHFDGEKVKVIKSEGKLSNTEKLVDKRIKVSGVQCGIGHTRWATHGKPTTQNAHPHRTDHLVLVHNGIIENYQEIKKEIISNGFVPKSETDSELIGFLIVQEMNQGQDLVSATRRAFDKIIGACSVVILSEKEPGKIIGVRRGSPLVVAMDPKGGVIFASDAQPILEYTQKVIFLENGDLVVGSTEGVQIYNLESGELQKRDVTVLDWSPEKIEKQGFPHYMLKEIHEQPQALVDTLNATLDRKKTDPFPLASQPGVEILKNAKSLVFIACGTSSYAALLGKYWIEKWAGIPVQVELASEFRYRDPVLMPGTVVVGISQSGETADTLAVMHEVRRLGFQTMAITNVRGSTISRETDATFFTSAGPEIGVAATKTFSTQMLILLLWAGFLGLKNKKMPTETIRSIFDELIQLPLMLEAALTRDSEFIKAVKKAALKLHQKPGFFFLGRGYSYPMALEGALKLKEIAYIHAEGHAAGELKHGPIAMLDENMVVVCLVPKDDWYDKNVSNLQEVKARGAVVLCVGEPEDESLKSQSDAWIPLPTLETAPIKKFSPMLFPFVIAPVVQLLSYEIANLRGTDIDKPRNLAKSVTVE